ncbi:MAG: TonB-dependent receptor [Rikenellaceae bacterium]
MKKILILSAFILLFSTNLTFGRTFSISGRVISEQSRQPISYASVVVDGQMSRGAVTDDEGNFTITNVEPGIFKVIASSLGYESTPSMEIQVSAKTPIVEIVMSQDSKQLEDVIITRSNFVAVAESPVSMRRIGVQEIEKSPGANRDVSKIVQSFPGVSFSPAAYRNDLIVRGGSPSENKFYLDGIEIPNINHFSTEGASGGPVGIINADLIREIDFYTGAFPVDKGGALSSMLDIKLRDGDTSDQSFKATLGASEVSLSGSGHFSPNTTYLFSVRQSYLQLLFKMIGLPFLPNFIDATSKVKHKFSDNQEVSFIAVAGFDDMSLNEEGTTATSEYILGYLPTITQQTYTVGATYRHFSGTHSQRISLSHNYLNTENIKYQDNDDSSSENLNYHIKSKSQKTTLQNVNRSYLGNWTLRYGADMSLLQYDISSISRYISADETLWNNYTSDLNYIDYALFAGGSYKSPSERFSASIGGRFSGNSFSGETAKFWRQFSPRLSSSYRLKRGFSLNANLGMYYQMPPQTALSYQEDGAKVNSNLDYMNVKQATVGADWRKGKELFISAEAFYKYYTDLPVSTQTNTPLADQGTDYGTIGNELFVQSGDGRAYGLEFLARWQIPGKVSLVGSLTLFQSEYRVDKSAEYRPSAWDSRIILNTSGTYYLPRGWSIGAKISATGGSPYTPYDADASAEIIVWDNSGQPTYDYSLYNAERTGGYAQLDIRVDKTFYFANWMLGLYLDIQNASKSSFTQQSIPVSTGEVDPNNPGYYIMKYLPNVSDTMLPTFGVTAQF